MTVARKPVPYCDNPLLRHREVPVQGARIPPPAKLPGEGALNATHLDCLGTLGIRDVSLDLVSATAMTANISRDLGKFLGHDDSHNYVSKPSG